MIRLALEYLLFIFVASCGVLQLAAVHSRLEGLSFFKKPLAGNLFGGLAIVGAFVWFFAIENRNVPGLEGSQQLGFFSLGAFLAIVFTLAVSSIVKAGMAPPQMESGRERGLDALKGMTYFQAIRRAVLRLLR